MGGRGASSGRSGSSRKLSATMKRLGLPNDPITRKYAKIGRDAYTAEANRSVLRENDIQGTAFNQVKTVRITSATPTSVRFEGSNHDWHGTKNSIEVSTARTQYVISKGEWSDRYTLVKRSGQLGRNEVAVASSKNIDTLIKKVQKNLK